MNHKFFFTSYILSISIFLSSCALDFDIKKKDGMVEGDVEVDVGEDLIHETTEWDLEFPDVPSDDSMDIIWDDGHEVAPDATVDGEDALDADMEEEIISCDEGEFRCTPEGAESCQGGSWIDLGTCPLGCDETAQLCRIPSNVPADALDPSAGDVGLSGGDSRIYINTETGEVTTSGGTVLRSAGTGRDPATGTTFTIVDQGAGNPQIGVFSVGAFTLPSGVTLYGVGSNGLAVAASGAVVIDGVINICAVGQDPGPGGWPGGDPGTAGAGTCPGDPGEGGDSTCIDYCSAGGGGGGFGGLGGNGGDGIGSSPFAGGSGGGPCGTPELIPLIGGSGGGGGGVATPGPSSPGAGGGGAGAVQLISALSVSIGSGGGVHAGGDGGRASNMGGGAGGGAGGAVLIEGPEVIVAAGAIIAANGGGGSAGDCT